MLIRRKLSQALAWTSRTIKGFLDDPQRMIGAAGVVMGVLVVAIGVVLTLAMFTPKLAASALAAVVAPLLTNLALAMIAIIGVVIMVMLGFKDFKARFMGAEVEASMVREASQDAAQALQELSNAVSPDQASTGSTDGK